MKNNILKHWYSKKPTAFSRLLWPASIVFRSVAAVRSCLYGLGGLKQARLPVPVIVVGNVAVGGTGKTPCVIYLANFLKAQGYRPGIVSRGYGVKLSAPKQVSKNDSPKEVGDEALLLSKQTGVPVVLCKNRVSAAQALLNEHDCNVIISDDGLQHYALGRDIEIVMMDGERRLGNHFCLPAGPLREPVSRLNQADFIVVTEGQAVGNEFLMTLKPADHLVSVENFSDQYMLADLHDKAVHAVAGIGNPKRFFSTLEALGFALTQHPFPDHYVFSKKDITFADDKFVIMTEKDAVKCRAFAAQNHWFLPVAAKFSAAFQQALLSKLKEVAS